MKRPLLYSFLIPSLLLFSYSSTHADTLYVHPAATGSGDGASWENAYTRLTSALFSAEYGDEIWVAQGEYFPTTGSSRLVSFSIPNGVKVYGGFSGGEAALEDRNWEVNPTILSGDIGVKGDSTDNSYTVVRMEGVDSTTFLDGFIIEKGVANDGNPGTPSESPMKNGGGIYIIGFNSISESRPHIRNCTIRHNYANSNGGGIAVYSKSGRWVSMIFENCEISGNTCRGSGGGVAMFGGGKEKASSFFGCVISNNQGSLFGGGISYVDNVGRKGFIVEQCHINQNRCNLSGAGFYYENLNANPGIVFFDKSFFYENIGGPNNEGGGIGAFDFTLLGAANIQLDSCFFMGNSTGGSGGVITLYEAKGIIKNSRFISNFSHNEGGVFETFNSKLLISNCYFMNNSTKEFSGGCFQLNNGELVIFNSKFFSNSSNRDGGCFSSNGTIMATNCLFIESKANGEGGVVYGGDNTFTNCTFYGFSAPMGSFSRRGNQKLYNCILIENRPDSVLKGPLAVGGAISISHTLIDRNNCDSIKSFIYFTDASCGPGMLYGLDPLFVQPDSGDFRLQLCSPAREAGSNSFLSPQDSLDLGGLPRIKGDSVDMGAYESPAFTVSLDSLSHITCKGDSSGSLWLSVQSACFPVSVQWGGLHYTADTTPLLLEGLSAGDHDLIVTDSQGLKAVIPLQIQEPALGLEVAVQATNASCTSGTPGTAASLITNGLPPFNYDWSSGLPDLPDHDSLPAGLYTLTITDSLGCMAVDSFTILAEGDLGVVAEFTSVSCHNSQDGSITVASFFGKAPRNWQWQDGATGNLRDSLGPGVYSVTLTDALNCMDSLTVTLTAPDSLSVVFDAPSLVCFDAGDVTVSAQVSGGTPPYTYLWPGGGTDSLATGLSPGTHMLTVTDIKGCEKIATVNVQAAPPLAVTDTVVTPASGPAQPDGAIMVGDIEGGVPPYTFQWTPAVDSTLSLHSLLPGEYILEVEDSLGCVRRFVFQVPVMVAGTAPEQPGWGYRLFPNPARQNISLEMEEALAGEATAITFYGPDGRLVLRLPLSTSQHQSLDLGDLAAGAYAYRLWLKAGGYRSGTVVVGR